jgi:hypothetical protein
VLRIVPIAALRGRFNRGSDAGVLFTEIFSPRFTGCVECVGDIIWLSYRIAAFARRSRESPSALPIGEIKRPGPVAAFASVSRVVSVSMWRASRRVDGFGRPTHDPDHVVVA